MCISVLRDNVNGQLQQIQSKEGKAAKGTELSGMKLRVIPADKKTRPAKVLAKGEENEW